jgi:histidinol-phosphate aminotransferase
MNINKFIRQNIQEMSAYASAREEFIEKAEIYLDANENPFETGINRYPDPVQTSVKIRLSEVKNIPIENILLGNGSDEILDLIFRAFCDPKKDNVIHTPPTFGMFQVLSRLNDIELRDSILNLDFSLDVEDILNRIDSNTKVIFLCSPNNPTGNLMPQDQVEKILEKSNCLVVVDEAYIDFASRASWISRLERYPNLIVCQTLSKAWGMAGIRLGICYASKDIITVLNKIKLPYNVNVLTQRKTLDSLNDIKEYERKLAQILLELKLISSRLEEGLATGIELEDVDDDNC